MAKGDIKMRPRAQRSDGLLCCQLHHSPPEVDVGAETGRRGHKQDEHRLGLEGTTHSSQNVISMQMNGAGIRDRK